MTISTVLADNQTWRDSYPLIPYNGEVPFIRYAIDDITVWADPSCALPLQIDAGINSDDKLSIVITDANKSNTLYAIQGNPHIYSEDGVLSGIVVWNDAGVVSVYSALKGKSNVTEYSVYIDPDVCVPTYDYPLSTISINDVPQSGSEIKITADSSTGVFQESTKDISKISMYASDLLDGSKDNPIKGILDPDTGTEVPINGHVWLMSGPTCDIRVLTSDGILISEVSNDKLQ